MLPDFPAGTGLPAQRDPGVVDPVNMPVMNQQRLLVDPVIVLPGDLARPVGLDARGATRRIATGGKHQVAFPDRGTGRQH